MLKIWIVSIIVISLISVAVLPTVDMLAYAQGVGGSAVNSGSGGGCSVDCTSPTLGVDNRGYRLISNGLTINEKTFDVQKYYQELPTQTFTVGETINIKLKIYENSGIDSIQHVELHLDNYEKRIQGILVEDNRISIVWDKEKGIEFDTDDKKIVENIEVDTIPIDDTTMLVTFSFQVTKPLDPSSIKVKMWDKNRSSWNNYFENAIQIINKPESIESENVLTITNNDNFTISKFEEQSEIQNIQQSIEYFENLAQIKSEQKDALLAQAESNIQLRQYEKSLDIYDTLLENEPEDTTLLNNKAHVLVLLERNYEANKIFEKIIKNEPRFIFAHTNYAISLFNQYEYDKALQSIDRALDVQSDYEFALGMKALILTEMEQYNDAKLVLDKALQINPLNVDALTVKAMTFQNEEKYNLALHYLDRVLELDPTFHHALLKKGEILYILGNLNDSKIYFAQAEQVYPNDRDTLLGSMMAHAESGELQVAQQVSNKIKDYTDPSYVDAQLFLATTYLSYDDQSSALDITSQILDYNLNNVSALLLQSKIFESLGNQEKSLHLIDTVLEIEPHNENAISYKEEILGIGPLRKTSHEIGSSLPEVNIESPKKAETNPEQFWLFTTTTFVSFAIIGTIMWRKNESSKWKMKLHTIDYGPTTKKYDE